MNLQIDKFNLKLYSSFNQTENFICLGSNYGFYVFLVNPFRKVISRAIDGGVSLIKMLYDTNIFLFVGRTDSGPYPNNKLIIWDDNKRIVLSEIIYYDKILNIDITKQHVIVCIRDKIFIYNFQTLEVIKTIETNNNKGLMYVGHQEIEFVVFPSNNIGCVNVYHIGNDNIETFQAHNSPIDNIYVSSNGNYIVTASEKGTIIRIFESTNYNKINEFRRGSEQTTITNICMNKNNSILLVSSEKGTIHLFNTDIDKNFIFKNKSFNNYGMNYIKFALPEYFSSEWSFAQFHLKNILSYSCFDKDTFRIFSICNDGQFYILNFENETQTIEKTIKYISDSSDPFDDRETTIK
jgi:WD40 repeat protein